MSWAKHATLAQQVAANAALMLWPGVVGQDPPNRDDRRQEVTVPAEHARAVIKVVSNHTLTEEDINWLREQGVPENLIQDLVQLYERIAFADAGRPARTRGRIGIPLPRPLVHDDLQEFARRLSLSDAQRVHFERQYEADYVPDARALWEQVAGPVWELSAKGTELRSSNPLRATMLSDMYKQCGSALARLRLFDEQFLTEALTPILADEQLARFEGVLLARRRAVSAPDLGSMPGAAIDLTELLHAIERRYTDRFLIMDFAAHKAILDEYERALTGQNDRAIDAWFRSATADAVYFAGGNFDTLQSAEEHRADRMRARRPFTQIAERIRRLNIDTLEQLAFTFSPITWALIDQEWKLRTLPVMYKVLDDPVRELYEQFIEDGPDLEKEARAMLIAMSPIHEQRVREIEERMERRIIEWKKYMLTQGGYEHDRYRSYRDDLHTMLHQRFAVMQQSIDLLISHLPDHIEELQEIRTMLETAETELTDISAGPEGTGWPGPTDGFVSHPASAYR